MELETILNLVGLVLNFTGVVLLALFPVDTRAPTRDGIQALGVYPGMERIQKNLIEYWHNLPHTRLGYFLLALGFTLQFIALMFGAA